jgi:hypothetical protein
VTADGLTSSQLIESSKTASNMGAVAEFNAQISNVKLRIDDLSNNPATERLYITHNTNRDSGTQVADDATFGITSIKFSDGSLTMNTNSSGNNLDIPRLNIANNGDISFYEDTGTTPKLFWDASAESLGIGTSSGTAPLEVSSSSTNVLRLHRDFATNSASSATIRFAGDDSAGNVTDYAEIRSFTEVVTNGSEAGALLFGTLSSGSVTERMRIDSSGNLLVGTTNSLAGINNTDEGISLRTSIGSASSIVVSRDAGVSGYFNRNSDGDVLSLRKDGSAVGTIGVTGTVLKINSTNSGIYVGGTSAVIYPQTDNAHNLGTSSLRFQDLYLSGGVYLGGTGSANYLDDYEEGTWTPSVSSGFTLDSTTTAVYRKIGDIVHVFGSITVDVTNGTEAVLAGLPFNCAVGNEAVLISFNNVSTFEYIPRARTNASLPQLKFNPQVTANNVQIMIQATYRTS